MWISNIVLSQKVLFGFLLDMFISVSLERYTQEKDFQFLFSVTFELQVQGLELPPEAVNEHNSSSHSKVFCSHQLVCMH